MAEEVGHELPAVVSFDLRLANKEGSILLPHHSLCCEGRRRLTIQNGRGILAQVLLAGGWSARLVVAHLTVVETNDVNLRVVLLLLYSDDSPDFGRLGSVLNRIYSVRLISNLYLILFSLFRLIDLVTKWLRLGDLLLIRRLDE